MDLDYSTCKEFPVADVVKGLTDDCGLAGSVEAKHDHETVARHYTLSYLPNLFLSELQIGKFLWDLLELNMI